MYASVFLKPAQDKADEANVSPILVLSYAAAYEVGYLLLGDDAHTSEGLMRGHWKAEDFQAMAQNRLHFTPEQTRELKRRYGAGRYDEAGTGNLIAGENSKPRR